MEHNKPYYEPSSVPLPTTTPHHNISSLKTEQTAKTLFIAGLILLLVSVGLFWFIFLELLLIPATLAVNIYNVVKHAFHEENNVRKWGRGSAIILIVMAVLLALVLVFAFLGGIISLIW